MNAENKAYLYEKYYHWYVLNNWGYLKDVNMDERRNFARIMREEFDPRFVGCLTCPASVAELVRNVFVNFEGYLKGGGGPMPGVLVEDGGKVTTYDPSGPVDESPRHRGRPRKGR